MHRLSVNDEFLVLTDTEETPMLIGALQFYEVPDGQRAEFHTAIRAHFEKRLPATPLLRVHRDAPFNFEPRSGWKSPAVISTGISSDSHGAGWDHQ